MITKTAVHKQPRCKIKKTNDQQSMIGIVLPIAAASDS